MGRASGLAGLLLPITLMVHSQVTFHAPWLRNRVTMCRHAATNDAGDACRYPHEYHQAFISWPNPMMTGCW